MLNIKDMDGGYEVLKFEPLADLAKENNLTPKETELFKLVAKYGYSNAQAAEAMNIAQKTVANQMRSLLFKMGCSSSRELLSKVIIELLPEEQQKSASY
jgi:DNA-binding CsgD family transcriptional regulator